MSAKLFREHIMTRQIVIFGAGGFGREVLQVVLDINEAVPGSFEPVAFLVDDNYTAETVVHGIPVISVSEYQRVYPEAQVVIAIGSSSARRKIVNRLNSKYSPEYAILIHPKAWIGRNVKIGSGTVICAGVMITTDVSIGNHVHINLGCTVGHDSVLSDYVTLNPSVNVSGNVDLREGVEVGTGSVLIPYANIGEWSVVGAGSIVTKPLDKNVTAVGGPAKVIKTRQNGWND